MPLYLNTLFTELVPVVNTAWTDVATGGVYRSRELNRVSMADKASSLPLACIDLRAIPWPDGPLNCRADLNRVYIYRVVDDTETADELLENLETLRLALYPDNPATRPLSSAQIMAYPLLRDDIELPLNQYFLNTGKPLYCGAVVADILIGDPA